MPCIFESPSRGSPLEDSTAYPPEVVEVRNTFIHVASQEAVERPISSCPSRIGWASSCLDDEAQEPCRQVLRLEEMLIPRHVGVIGDRPRAAASSDRKELPSLGSAGHAFGTCKPCGFFYAKGCLNGVSCSFCHLCDRGEKKRRQKHKKASLKGGG